MIRSHLMSFVLSGLMFTVSFSGCGEEVALVNVHNEIREIESEWLETHYQNNEVTEKLQKSVVKYSVAFDKAQDPAERRLTLQTLIRELKLLKGRSMGAHYRVAFNEWLDNIVKLQAAIDANDKSSISYHHQQDDVLIDKAMNTFRDQRVAAAKKAARRIASLDLTDIPEDYQAALRIWEGNIREVAKSILEKDDRVCNGLVKKSKPLVEELNVIAEKHGLIITR